MISIGLTTWSDHPALLHNEHRAVKLTEYAAYFPTVEVDNPFYGIPRPSTVLNWQRQVPAHFQFILKANQVMTLHDLYKGPINDLEARQAAFRRFADVVAPLRSTQQLKTILLQFPPYFQFSSEHVAYLQWIREWWPKMPITIEFRHASWYQHWQMISALLTKLHFTHAMVDEPHNRNNGVPFVNTITNPDLALLRLHGRNQSGWFNQGPDWRQKRTLYRYSNQELSNLARLVKQINHSCHEVCVIFNNNSGKDAAPNALKLRDDLHLHFNNLAPHQIDLF